MRVADRSVTIGTIYFGQFWPDFDHNSDWKSLSKIRPKWTIQTSEWIDITQHRDTMKEINKIIKGRFHYKETGLKWILQQSHRHRRENWKINLNLEKPSWKRKGANFCRGDVKS